MPVLCCCIRCRIDRSTLRFSLFIRTTRAPSLRFVLGFACVSRGGVAIRFSCVFWFGGCQMNRDPRALVCFSFCSARLPSHIQIWRVLSRESICRGPDPLPLRLSTNPVACTCSFFLLFLYVHIPQVFTMQRTSRPCNNVLFYIVEFSELLRHHELIEFVLLVSQCYRSTLYLYIDTTPFL